MKALITGAAKGLGLEFAKLLEKRGYKLILVDCDEEALAKAKAIFPSDTKAWKMDLSDMGDVKKLAGKIDDEQVDVLINNAGYGYYGAFEQTDLDREMNMLDLNVRAVHVLTKAAFTMMLKRGRGYILNVSSTAGFMPGGPMMAAYYATKAYVRSLTEAANYEARLKKPNVVVSVLCPGPMDTNFSETASVKFASHELSPQKVAKYTLKQMMDKKKMLVIPGWQMKAVKFFSRFFSDRQLLKWTRQFQKSRKK